MNIKYYCGPTNENYGYSLDMCAPAAQVRAASRKRGPAMWNALERCSWTDVSGKKERTVGRTSSVDGETLILSPFPIN
jgi:hypothetical protein